jgi:hypothetical protein
MKTLSKVNKLDEHIFIEQNIGGLAVQMNDAIATKISQSLHYCKS